MKKILENAKDSNVNPVLAETGSSGFYLKRREIFKIR